MYQLPTEIQSIIYEYDPTFHDNYKIIIQELINYKYYYFQVDSVCTFYVYCPKSCTFHVTNSLQSPNYIRTVYNIHYLQFRKLVRLYHLIEDKSLKVEYDIEANIGRPLLQN